jgi:hypothetical protein
MFLLEFVLASYHFEIRAILLPAEMFVSELIPKQSREPTNGGAPISQPNRNDRLQNSSIEHLS